jgi:hypothetical protein
MSAVFFDTVGLLAAWDVAVNGTPPPNRRFKTLLKSEMK